MTGKNVFSIRIEQNIMEQVQKEAHTRNISKASVITGILHDHYKQKLQSSTPQEESEIATLYLRPATKKKLLRKAHQTNMPSEDYIEYLMEPKQLFQLKMVVNDLQELNTCFRDLVTTINAVAKVMLQTNTAFEVQVERITCLLEKIHELFSKTYFLEREQRNDLLEKAYRSINEEIVRYRESEKRALRRKRQTEGSKDASHKDQGLPQQ